MSTHQKSALLCGKGKSMTAKQQLSFVLIGDEGWLSGEISTEQKVTCLLTGKCLNLLLITLSEHHC